MKAWAHHKQKHFAQIRRRPSPYHTIFSPTTTTRRQVAASFCSIDIYYTFWVDSDDKCVWLKENPTVSVTTTASSVWWARAMPLIGEAKLWFKHRSETARAAIHGNWRALRLTHLVGRHSRILAAHQPGWCHTWQCVPLDDPIAREQHG